MLKRSVRSLAVTALTIVSATVLTVLGATGVSASPTAGANSGHARAAASTILLAAPAAASARPDTSPVTCGEAQIGRECGQVKGSGLYVSGWNSWYNNTTPYTESNLHIELYYNPSHGGQPGPTFSRSVPIHNCPGFNNIKPDSNSPVCGWPGAPSNVNAGDYCSALWYYYGGTIGYFLEGWECVYVFP